MMILDALYQTVSIFSFDEEDAGAHIGAAYSRTGLTIIVSIKAQAMKVARLYEMFPQAELRRLEQVKCEAAHKAAETPEQSQARRQQNAQYLAFQWAAETPEQSQTL
ncbi:hypothetical protein TNCV_1362691 [Trichonephila clavipes]|nr:hypothetical protein TNCV_1362691 [Trichonephila clavipes]